ncbi:MAG TPA: histidine phosphatase family protein [Candidatus Binataceae bacterium]|nr:histidine phosphatase family protein [Candidatus Binataceae bacterium]
MALGPFYVAQKLKQPGGLRGVALLMRHGETAWNRSGRVMGRNPIELDAEGRAQVERAVPFARELAIDLIVSSPLPRARQSAEIIATGIGNVGVSENPELSEVQYGRWEGMVFDDLIKDPEYVRYREHPLDHPTPGGETILHVQTRGVEAIARAIGANPGKRILFVSHGDIIRTVLTHFMGLELSQFRRLRIDNATFSAFQLAGDFAEIKFLNLLPDPGRAFVAPFTPKSSANSNKPGA